VGELVVWRRANHSRLKLTRFLVEPQPGSALFQRTVEAMAYVELECSRVAAVARGHHTPPASSSQARSTAAAHPECGVIPNIPAAGCTGAIRPLP
jgi:hypothetical protein